MVYKFDTKVQLVKYKVLREVARQAWKDTLYENLLDIPQIIVPGKEPTMRCCVYKERAILGERVKIAMGGDRESDNPIQVIDIACDECPVGGYEVTNACRGCLAHRCKTVCKFGALTLDHNHVAHIDKSKCKECGACAKVCPYTAIVNRVRPCENACKVKAITMNEDKAAQINEEKCVACGVCVYQCPFGAITDKSNILSVVDLVKSSDFGKKSPLYAIVAPAVSSQFVYAKLGQVIAGIKELGFTDTLEVALGADIVAYAESKELVEKGFLISSCCPAFVSFVKNEFPNLTEYISQNLSPMAALAKYLKEKEPTAKVVFIGPCTAKKKEAKKAQVEPYVDAVLTFEELQALFDSRDINIMELEEAQWGGASYFGRIFARSGGLAEAVRQGLKEHGFEHFNYKPHSCDGIDACRVALLKKSKGMLDANFIEGMACIGGCIGGAGCLTHGERNRAQVDVYGKGAGEMTITESVEKM